MNLRLTLPLAPSLNNAYATARLPNGSTRRFKSAKALEYSDTAIMHTRDERNRQEFYPPAGARLGVVYRMWFPTRARDLDNAVKLAQDAICTALGVNDNTIDYIEVHRMEVDKLNPHCEVEVYVRSEV